MIGATRKKNGLPKSEKEPSRDQVAAAFATEFERLLLSDATLQNLRTMKKGLPLIERYLTRERKRKTRSPEFQWLMAQVGRPKFPVDKNALSLFTDLLRAMREQQEGAAVPPDAGKVFLGRLQSFLETRKDPKYWKEYQAYLSGRPVSDILREFHPEYERLKTWERGKYFRKVYNALQRLVAKYGGPALKEPPLSHP